MKTTTLWREQSTKPFWGFLIVSCSGFFHLAGTIARTSDNMLSLMGAYRTDLNLWLDATERLAPLSALIGYLIFVLSMHYLAGLFTGKSASALRWMGAAGWLFIIAEWFYWLFGSTCVPGELFALSGYTAMLAGGIRMRHQELPEGIRTAGLLLIVSASFRFLGIVFRVVPAIDFILAIPLQFSGWILSLLAWFFFQSAQPTEGLAAKVYTCYELKDTPGGLLLKTGFALTCLLFAFEQFYLPVVSIVAHYGRDSYAAGPPEEHLYIAYAYPYFLFALIPVLLYCIAWFRQTRQPDIRRIAVPMTLYCLFLLATHASSYIYTLQTGHRAECCAGLSVFVQVSLLFAAGIGLMRSRRPNNKLNRAGKLLLLCTLYPLLGYLASVLATFNIPGFDSHKIFCSHILPVMEPITAALFYYGSKIVFLTTFRLSHPLPTETRLP